MTLEIIGEKIGGNWPWVAEIQKGRDPKFGLTRKFVDGVVDWGGANSKKTRGVGKSFLLASGKIYEKSLPQSWNSTDRGFFALNSRGEMIELTPEMVRRARLI